MWQAKDTTDVTSLLPHSVPPIAVRDWIWQAYVPVQQGLVPNGNLHIGDMGCERGEVDMGDAMMGTIGGPR